METITREIERALSAGLYYLALISTLSLPDICAALESSNGETSGAKYQAWYATWLTTYPEITGNDLYSLRCGVVHQGRLGHPKSQYSRILFTLPSTRAYLHQNIINDALNLDLETFCRDMIEAVLRWYGVYPDGWTA